MQFYARAEHAREGNVTFTEFTFFPGSDQVFPVCLIDYALFGNCSTNWHVFILKYLLSKKHFENKLVSFLLDTSLVMCK